MIDLESGMGQLPDMLCTEKRELDMDTNAYLQRLARTCRWASRQTLSSHRSLTSGRSKGDAKKAGTARVESAPVTSVWYIGVEGGNDGVKSELSDAV